MVKLLLNKGANLSAMDKKERQPVHCAAYLGTSVVRQLIGGMAGDTQVLLLPLCAVHRARGCREVAGFSQCRQKLQGQAGLHTPPRRCGQRPHRNCKVPPENGGGGALTRSRRLLDAPSTSDRAAVAFRPQIDEPNGFGNTPLHVACYMGQEAVATELVNHGANVNQPNKCGYTPLHLAAVSTNGALCLELLVNNGADVNQQVGTIRSDEGQPGKSVGFITSLCRSHTVVQRGNVWTFLLEIGRAHV